MLSHFYRCIKNFLMAEALYSNNFSCFPFYCREPVSMLLRTFCGLPQREARFTAVRPSSFSPAPRYSQQQIFIVERKNKMTAFFQQFFRISGSHRKHLRIFHDPPVIRKPAPIKHMDLPELFFARYQPEGHYPHKFRIVRVIQSLPLPVPARKRGRLQTSARERGPSAVQESRRDRPRQ